MIVVNALFERILLFLPEPWRGLAIPFLVFVIVVALGLVVRRIAFARLRRWARTTVTRFDENLLDSLHGPVLLWILILAIYVATDISRLPREIATLVGASPAGPVDLVANARSNAGSFTLGKSLRSRWHAA